MKSGRAKEKDHKKDCVARFFVKRSGNGAHLPFAERKGLQAEFAKKRAPEKDLRSKDFSGKRSGNGAHLSFAERKGLEAKFAKKRAPEKDCVAKIFWERGAATERTCPLRNAKGSKRSLPRRASVVKWI